MRLMNDQILTIDRKKCTGCLLCEKVCIRNAVNAGEFSIDKLKCFSCFHCVSVCPEQAVLYNGSCTNKLSDYKIADKEFDNLIFSRRSCRVFTDKIIESRILDEITHLLSYSPTGSNSQNVHLTILSGRRRIRKLTDGVINLFGFILRLKLLFFPLLLIILGLKNTRKFFGMKNGVNRYYKGEDILAFNAPVLILFHSSSKISSTPAEDCDIAASISMLKAEIMGLGTCFNGFIVRALNFSRKLRRDVEIPSDHRIYTSLLLGYPGVKYKNLIYRNPLKINHLNDE